MILNGVPFPASLYPHRESITGRFFEDDYSFIKEYLSLDMFSRPNPAALDKTANMYYIERKGRMSKCI